MRKILAMALALAWGGLTPLPAAAQSMMVEDFSVQPETRWRFLADTVMGGVSTGQLRFETEEGRAHARLTGQVSTANNGGFIQMRLDLDSPPPAGAKGLRLVVRGNDTRYFAHLRTHSTLLPWQYFQAGFMVTPDWVEVRLPFDRFAPSGRLIGKHPKPDGLTSVGIVAFGRDHAADISVREVGFY
ncbi:CIA30 family protein [Tabrizicola sp.]|uniref:CIA30 family protein n=1 Tax=Tabrizicola sp. TaxID=2005166 RepID=UPI003D28BD4D